MGKYLYILACLFFFGVGAYAWKVKSTGEALVHLGDEAMQVKPLAPGSVLMEVDGEPITVSDVDWEYRLHTLGAFDEAELTPASWGDEDARLSPLRKKLLTALVERKLLYAFIQKDKAFDPSEPARLGACLKEWHETLAAGHKQLVSGEAEVRLKARLCEKDLLQQYLNGRLFAKLEVSFQEVRRYAEAHPEVLRQPERVQIRQIVLADEQEAKRARARVDGSNFGRLARQKSIAPEAHSGGLLRPFARGEMPRVFDGAFNMEEGQVSPILKSTYGFHIILLEKKFAARQLTSRQAAGKISELILSQKRQEAYRQWVERALATVRVAPGKPTWQ